VHKAIMPRTMQVLSPGAIDHVMGRGDRRDEILLDEVARQSFAYHPKSDDLQTCIITCWPRE
jgi:hypothetical protein